MLNHSAWASLLPRNITPSDVDMTFDNHGDMLLCEISSQHTLWTQIKAGQLINYFSLIAPVSKHFAVLVSHNVKGRQIDTVADIESFHIMIRKDKVMLFWPGVDRAAGASQWVKFVQWWFSDPKIARRWIVKRAVIANLQVDELAWLMDYMTGYQKAHGEKPW